MPHWVVRAGEASPGSLKKGYRQYPNMPIYGLSVQYDAQASIDTLARAGQFPNTTISYASRQSLAAALLQIGYQMQLIKTPGKGYHHTFMVVYTQGSIVIDLPDNAARVISATFRRMPNPHPATPTP